MAESTEIAWPDELSPTCNTTTNENCQAGFLSEEHTESQNFPVTLVSKDGFILPMSAVMPRPRKKNKKRVELTLEQRMMVVQMSEAGGSQRKIAQRFSCGKTQVHRILQRKEEVKEAFHNLQQPSRKRMKTKLHYDEIDELTFDWYLAARERSVPITGTALQDMAKHFAKAKDIGSFRASNGWLSSFVKRNNIVLSSPRLHNNGSDSASVTSLDDWHKSLHSLLDVYRPGDVFAVTELGLYYSALPDSTLCEKDSQTTADCGNRHAEDSLTLLMCTSMLGEKIPLTVITTSNAFFCDNDSSVFSGEFLYNENGVVTRDMMKYWLEKLHTNMQTVGREIVLFMDQKLFSCEYVFSNMTIAPFPPASLNYIYPFGQGIFRTFKCIYRKILLDCILGLHLLDSAAISEHISLSNVAQWIEEAWCEVPKETVINGFLVAGFAAEESAIIKLEISSDNVETQLQKLVELYQRLVSTDCSVSKYISFEDNLHTYDHEIPLEQQEDKMTVTQTGNAKCIKSTSCMQADAVSEEQVLLHERGTFLSDSTVFQNSDLALNSKEQIGIKVEFELKDSNEPQSFLEIENNTINKASLPKITALNAEVNSPKHFKIDPATKTSMVEELDNSYFSSTSFPCDVVGSGDLKRQRQAVDKQLHEVRQGFEPKGHSSRMMTLDDVALALQEIRQFAAAQGYSDLVSLIAAAENNVSNKTQQKLTNH